MEGRQCGEEDVRRGEGEKVKKGAGVVVYVACGRVEGGGGEREWSKEVNMMEEREQKGRWRHDREGERKSKKEGEGGV